MTGGGGTMAIFLTVLKILGILILVLLCAVIAVVLGILFVPFRYKVRAESMDPEPHEKFSASVLKEHIQAQAAVTWCLHLLTIQMVYPHSEKEFLTVKIFGKKIALQRHHGGKKREQTQQKKAQRSFLQRLEEMPDKVETVCNRIDHYFRILTGTCGRRAFAKLMERLGFLWDRAAPTAWSLTGTAGLGDPYLSGKIAEVTAILGPLTEDNLRIDVEWEAFRLDLHGELEGRIRGILLVRTALPILLDKDCRKLVRKWKAAKKRDFTPQGMHERVVLREKKAAEKAGQGEAA